MRTTVIIITYNQEKYILDSLLSIENQTILPDQLIVADDCSQDNTYEKIQGFVSKSKIKNIVAFSNETNLGIVKNFNEALKRIDGDIVLIQAGDDFSEKMRIEQTLDIFQKCDATMIYTSYKIVNENGDFKKNIIREGVYKEFDFFIKKGAGIAPFGGAFNINKYNKKIQIPEILRNEDDYLTFLSIKEGGIRVIKNVLYNFRVNTGVSSWMYSKDVTKEALVKNYKEDILNRIENYKCWKSLLSNDDDINMQLLKKRIELTIFIQNLENSSYYNRLSTLVKCKSITTIREKLVLLGGFGILFYLAKIKRILLGI
ncbi:glycosyltransferase [Chitinophagaceae bacterium LWZ2-11]